MNAETRVRPASIRGPTLDHSGERVYFTDQHGGRWRVYHVGLGPPHGARGTRRGHRPPAPRANYRWFVAADGTARCIELESERAVTVEVLAGQLVQSSYSGTQRFDSSAHRP